VRTSLVCRNLEKITHFYSVKIRKNNYLRNVRGLLARQLLKLLHLYPAPFQHHTFCAETTVRTHPTQLLPDRHRPKYTVLVTKGKGKAPAYESVMDADEPDPRITIYVQGIAPSCWSNLSIISATFQSPRLYGLAVSSAIRDGSQTWLRRSETIQTFLTFLLDMITLCRLYR